LGFHHLSKPNPRSHLANATWLLSKASLERKKQNNFPLHLLPSPLYLDKDPQPGSGNNQSQAMDSGRLEMQCLRNSHPLGLTAKPLQGSPKKLHSPSQNCLQSELLVPSPPGFVKLNFNGSSKGNLGPAGFGAVLRDNEGIILHITAGYLIFNKNNVAELCNLLKGINLAISHNIIQLIVEGESQVIIQLISKIIHGPHPSEISSRWRSRIVGRL